MLLMYQRYSFGLINQTNLAYKNHKHTNAKASYRGIINLVFHIEFIILVLIVVFRATNTNSLGYLLQRLLFF